MGQWLPQRLSRRLSAAEQRGYVPERLRYPSTAPSATTTATTAAAIAARRLRVFFSTENGSVRFYQEPDVTEHGAVADAAAVRIVSVATADSGPSDSFLSRHANVYLPVPAGLPANLLPHAAFDAALSGHATVVLLRLVTGHEPLAHSHSGHRLRTDATSGHGRRTRTARTGTGISS